MAIQLVPQFLVQFNHCDYRYNFVKSGNRFHDLKNISWEIRFGEFRSPWKYSSWSLRSWHRRFCPRKVMSPLNTQKEALISRAQSFLFDSKVSFHYDLKSRKWHFTFCVWRKKRSKFHTTGKTFFYPLFSISVGCKNKLHLKFRILNTQYTARITIRLSISQWAQISAKTKESQNHGCIFQSRLLN